MSNDLIQYGESFFAFFLFHKNVKLFFCIYSFLAFTFAHIEVKPSFLSSSSSSSFRIQTYDEREEQNKVVVVAAA